jgi:hypothetical protein
VVSGRKTPSGPGENPNPWVRRLPGDEPDEDVGTKTEPVVSPWNYPVDPPPGTGTGTPDGGGPAQPPSLRRTPAEPKRRGAVRKTLIPVLAALVVVAVIGVVLLNVLGSNEPSSTLSTPPSGTPSASVGTPAGGPSTPAPSTPAPTGSSGSTGPSAPGSSSTYVPPRNALPVGYGVSVVPAPGWTVFTAETEGKELVPSAPNDHSTWFWVRQRQNVTAEDYAIRIFEGETRGGSQVKAGPTRKPDCPRDVLTECVTISYSMVLPKERSGLSMRCEVQAFRRTDGVATAMDFCSRPAFYAKAYADAKLMLKTVIDSQ